MRSLRYPLIAAAALVAMLVGTQAAEAANVPTKRGYGYAKFFDDGPRPTLQACDARRDGAGIVAFAFDNRDFSFLADAGVRRGKGKCGPVNEVGFASSEYVVVVCRHDRSEDEDGYSGWKDPDIELSTCGEEVFD
jgi:hypothetical protein